jgi:hypothetical protein
LAPGWAAHTLRLTSVSSIGISAYCDLLIVTVGTTSWCSPIPDVHVHFREVGASNITYIEDPIVPAYLNG